MILDYFPVLTYHKISPQKEFGLTTISPEYFEQQLNIIANSNFNPITFRELSQKSALPEKPVIITFDDGYESVYHYAVPLLKKYGFKAVIYVLSDYIGKYNTWEAYKIQRRYRHLNENQIKELVESGFEIGSHGKAHKYLNKLDGIGLHKEINNSKQEIEIITQEQILSFCYPYGLSNKRVQDEVKRCGYKCAVGNMTLNGINKQEIYHLGRRSIYATDSIRIFKQKLLKPEIKHTSVFTEKVIRAGASAGIIKKILSNN